MIPDQYWQLIRRWLWLIVACVVVGGLAGLYVAPSYVGSTSSASSSMTLATSRYISLSRIVTAGEANFDDDVVIGDYTKSLVAYAGTPHFAVSLRDRLAEQGTAISTASIQRKVTVTADPTLFRIEVQAAAPTRADAETLVSASADVLATKASEEEDRLASGLIAILEQERDELSSRIDSLERERASLGQPGGTERDRRIIDLEIHAADEQLGEMTRQREQLLLTRSFSNPVVEVHPPETVETEEDSLPPRDLLLLGTVIGLIVGWVLAIVAERLAPEAPTAPAPSRASPARPASAEALAANDRVRALLSRVTRLEQRARALRDFTSGASDAGRP